MKIICMSPNYRIRNENSGLMPLELPPMCSFKDLINSLHNPHNE